MLYGGGGNLPTPAPARHSDLLWTIVCFLLGLIGLFAFTLPLFGFLSYGGVFVFPLAVVGEIGFGIAGVVVGGRWRIAYMLGNLGLVAGTAVLVVAELAFFIAQPGRQPDSDVWRPLYFGVVLMGLAGGITLGALMRPAPAPQSNSHG